MENDIDKRPIQDKYRNWTNELIKEDLTKNSFPCAALFSMTTQDFNLSSLIRNANNFSIRKVFYYSSKKHWDRRGTCGSHWYSNIQWLDNIESIKSLKEQYVFVGLENNIEKPIVPISEFKFPENSLIIIGNECDGISKEVLELVDHFVSIPSLGSVRSINAACASAIAMYEYVRQWSK